MNETRSLRGATPSRPNHGPGSPRDLHTALRDLGLRREDRVMMVLDHTLAFPAGFAPRPQVMSPRETQLTDRSARTTVSTHHNVVVGNTARSRRLNTYIRRDVHVRKGCEETGDGKRREATHGVIVIGRARCGGGRPRDGLSHPPLDDDGGT